MPRHPQRTSPGRRGDICTGARRSCGRAGLGPSSASCTKSAGSRQECARLRRLKRNRQGSAGVPLASELRSFASEGSFVEGTPNGPVARITAALYRDRAYGRAPSKVPRSHPALEGCSLRGPLFWRPRFALRLGKPQDTAVCPHKSNDQFVPVPAHCRCGSIRILSTGVAQHPAASKAYFLHGTSAIAIWRGRDSEPLDAARLQRRPMYSAGCC